MKRKLIYLLALAVTPLVGCDTFSELSDAKEVAPIAVNVDLDIAVENLAAVKGLTVKFDNYDEALHYTKEISGESVNMDGILPGIYTVSVSGTALDSDNNEYYVNGNIVNAATNEVIPNSELKKMLDEDSYYDYIRGNRQRIGSIPLWGCTAACAVVSASCYIVTNNHVIDNATEVEVTLNDKRTFKAEIVGVDTSTDIALLKIDADTLPILSLGNSDLLKIGEWVLAVGNPFNLTSTVTAGIVSAKARDINILNSEMKIESFIQTDAAVNPGNSGGALVNTNGELVGINTAIASQTGSYAGYSFAIPVSIVGKVIADLKEFGVVQRAVLGVQIRNITDEFAKEKGLKTLKGAYVVSVVKGSSAEVADLKEGDIIISVNDVQVETSSQLQEQVGRYRPGNKVKVGYIRNMKQYEVVVELKNRSGNTNVVKAVDLNILGAKFSPVSESFKYKYRIKGGILVDSVEREGLFSQSGIRKGFVILKINNENVYSLKDMENVLSKVQSTDEEYRALFVSGLYPDGKIVHYAVNLTSN